MATNKLKPKIDIVKTDVMVRVLTLQDVTGAYDSETNPNGYGYPNKSTSEVTAVLVRIKNPFDGHDEKTVRFNSDFDPLHPEYLVVPTANQIADGHVFDINSYVLGATKYDEGYKTFRDGVLDVDYYVAFENITVSGTKGNPFITGTGLHEVLANFDSIIVGTSIYDLNKSMPTNGGTVLYLNKDLEENVTTVKVADKGNVKLYNKFRSKCILKRAGHILSSGYSYRERMLEKENGVMKVATNMEAMDICWESEDYTAVNRLTNENLRIGTLLGIIKNGNIVD